MYSLAKEYQIPTGYEDVNNLSRKVILTAVRMANDINGNPRYKAQLWVKHQAGIQHIWSPTIKGYRRSKDDTYVLKSVYNLEAEMDNFIQTLIESLMTSINEGL